MSSCCLQSNPDYSKVPTPTPILTISFNPKWLIGTQPCSSYRTLTFIIPVLYKQPERGLLMFLSTWRPVFWAAVVIDSSIIYTVLRFNLVMQYMRENPPLNVMLSEIFVFDLLKSLPSSSSYGLLTGLEGFRVSEGAGPRYWVTAYCYCIYWQIDRVISSPRRWTSI